MKRKDKFALISVSNKKNLQDFANFLKENNFHIVSTGGTKEYLEDKGFKVTSVSELIDFPEILGGRVKTLHPHIHAGILARENDSDLLEELNIKRIDLVVVNFYPFEEIIKDKSNTLHDIIENIDIGGPTMVRAAAKNYINCSVITDFKDYENFTKNYKDNDGELTLEFRKWLSIKAFQSVTHYDSCISNYLSMEVEETRFPSRIFYSFIKEKDLRYGENSHQSASIYSNAFSDYGTLVNSRILQGKEISFNNVVDSETAIKCAMSFKEPSCVIVKHANPCGVSVSNDSKTAYSNAYVCDPTSAFGGVIAFNSKINASVIEEIYKNQFVEIILAPKIDEDALDIAKSKEKVRLIEYGKDKEFSEPDKFEIKTIQNGILLQTSDNKFESNEYKIVTKNKLTDGEKENLFFAWNVCKFVKSNAIVFANNKNTIGIGAGQMSRVDSTNIAISKAKAQGLELDKCVMASDGFFPFADSIDIAAQIGVKAIIQPGGSINDKEIIEAAEKYNISMVFTNVRHFKH